MSAEDLPIAEFAFPGPLRDQLVAAIVAGDKITTTGLVTDYEHEGEPLHTPPHRFAARAWMRGDVLAGHGSAGGYYPAVSSIKIADQDVGMHAGHGPVAIQWFPGRKAAGHAAAVPV